MTNPKYISSITIEKIAEQIRADCLLSRGEDAFLEIDIYRIAESLGCKIEIVDFTPENISARVERGVSSDKYTIQVSRKDSPRRQKFSIAHEISHIILHDGNEEEEFIELRRPLVDYTLDELYKETQANMMASALLLPSEQVKAFWNSTKSIDEVAEVFNVSKEAVCNRLINLGLLQNE